MATAIELQARIGKVENDARMALSRAGAGSTLAKSLEYTFVYRPGGVAGANVFTTFAALDAAMALVQGPKLVEVDGTIQAPHVPAGVWTHAFEDATYTVNPSSAIPGGTQLTFDAGATFTSHNLRLEGSITFQNTGTVVWTIDATTPLTLLDVSDFAAVIASPGAAFIHVPNGATLAAVSLLPGGFGDTTNPVFLVDAGGTLDSTAATGGGFTQNAVTGAGTWNLGLIADGLFSGPQPLAPASIVNTAQAPIAEKNAGGLGPGNTIAFSSTATLQRMASGKVRVAGTIEFTPAVGSGPSTVTVNLLRDAVVIGTQHVGVNAAIPDSCTISWVDTLPDLATHTYGIEAIDAGAALTSPAGGALISAEELPA